jgi:hypothetical protein
MKTLALKAGILMVLLVAACHAHAGEIVDRIVASVNNVPLLQTDWDQAVAFEALEQGRAVQSFTAKERRGVLDRMVDQQLLRSQMGDENTAAAEDREIAKQVEKIRALYPEAETDGGWQQVLTRYGLDAAFVTQKVARQLQVMRFVELRLRPESRVARADIEDYYKETLIPAVRSHGGKEESLAEVYPRIEEILRQQRMDELLTTWLHDLRDHSEIHWIGVDASDPAEPSDAVALSGGR